MVEQRNAIFPGLPKKCPGNAVFTGISYRREDIRAFVTACFFNHPFHEMKCAVSPDYLNSNNFDGLIDFVQENRAVGGFSWDSSLGHYIIGCFGLNDCKCRI